MSTTQQAYDFLAPPSQDDDLGMLGSYRIINELGKGGMGYVFRAEDTRLKRTVALKVMNKKIAATPNSRKRFLEEARAMAAVHHDNVVVIFEVGEKAGTPFMAMELLGGSTLEALNAKKQKLSYEQILNFAIQIARGLAAAHEKGIVHRDIKPANIWIVKETDRIKILDFGLALAQTPVDRLAGTGSVIGTPGYLSPEQARTDPLDDRSDLYSLGVVLYEMCTGRLPLQASTVAGQLVAILAHKPTPIRELNPDIPAPLANLIHRLLAKESRDRPSSAIVLEGLLRDAAIECEAKSEVALAINKLQQGLSEAVNKKDGMSFEAVPDVMPAAVENPLDFTSLPSAAGAAPAAVPSPAVRPLPARRAAATKPSNHSNLLTEYWPYLAIAAAFVVLILIGLFVVTSVGDSQASNQTTITVPPSSPSVADPPTSKSLANDDRPTPQVTSETVQSAAKVPVESPVESAAERTDEVPETPAPKVDTPKPDATSLPTRPSSPSEPPSSASLEKPEMIDTPELEPERTQPRPEHPGPERVKEESLREIRVTTADGIGADSTVSRSSPLEPLGKEPSIAVRMRKGVELNHAYLRFDLSSLEVPREKIRKAELVLRLPEDEKPVRSLLRLYGTNVKGSELWKEAGPAAILWNNSFSKVGLDQIEKFSEMRFSGDSIGPDGEIRMGGEKLAEFLRSAKTDSVNLVLAGGQANHRILRFVSHEASSGDPPTLILHVE